MSVGLEYRSVVSELSSFRMVTSRKWAWWSESELDGPVERVDMVKEGIQTATIPGPNEEDIINVSPLNPGTARSCTEHTVFKVSQEETGK